MLLVKNGNVYLGKGRYEAGWDVLCQDGLIKEVGKGLDGTGAKVVDAGGRDVYPGLVLGLCGVGAVSFSESGGWDLNEAASPSVPHMDIRDAFDLRELKRQRFGRAGITSYGLCPGTKALLAGQISLIHTDGDSTDDVFIAERIAVKGNYIGTVKQTFKDKAAPQTKMAMYQMLDEGFRAAREYMDKEEKDYDAAKEVLCHILRREIPLVIVTESAADVDSVKRLGVKHDLRLVIAGAYGLRDAEDIISRGWHVMLGNSEYDIVGLKNDISHKAFVEMYRKGLKLSIYGSGDSAYPPAYEQLHWTAAQMRAAGAEGWEIIDMMTINPAEALGVSNLVGSLEAGKQADIIICKGNPALRYDNYIDRTIVAGREFFAREGE